MDVLITTGVAPAFSVPGIGGTSAASALSAPALTALTSGATEVQISRLGQLFAAASTFQSQLSAINPGAESSGTALNLGANFASLAVEAQNFVDAFNQAQSSVAGLSNLTQATQFAQALKDRVAATFANGDSGVNLLSQLGIALRPDGALSLDLRALQTQFNANPPATFSLLTNAVRSFESLAAGLPIGNQPGTSPGISNSVLDALSQIIAFQALFTGTGSSTTPLGLGTLLALGPVGQGGATDNLGQHITALSHFALVSSLLA